MLHNLSKILQKCFVYAFSVTMSPLKLVTKHPNGVNWIGNFLKLCNIVYIM